MATNEHKLTIYQKNGKTIVLTDSKNSMSIHALESKIINSMLSPQILKIKTDNDLVVIRSDEISSVILTAPGQILQTMEEKFPTINKQINSITTTETTVDKIDKFIKNNTSVEIDMPVNDIKKEIDKKDKIAEETSINEYDETLVIDYNE